MKIKKARQYKWIIKGFIFIAIFYPYCLFAKNNYHSANENDYIRIGNNHIEVSFDAVTGALHEIKRVGNSNECMVCSNSNQYSIWEILLGDPSQNNVLSIKESNTFRYFKINSGHLRLEWSNFRNFSNNSLVVEVDVLVEPNNPMTKWHISVDGINQKKIGRVIFPKLEGIKEYGEENLAVPVWMGELIKNPRGEMGLNFVPEKKYSWNYPGPLSMQFIAIENQQKHGFYFSADDTLGYFKQFSLKVDSSRNLAYQINNYPSFDSALHSYHMPYNAVIGFYQGDWISAALIYRDWAVKQGWCKQSRFLNKTEKTWIDQTALWVWNRGKSENVLSPAEDLKKRIGLPINVLWHWWHGCAYDDGFPEYFPPREGEESFKTALKKSEKEGINSILYMNSFQWGTSTSSFQSEHASIFAVKNIREKMEPHVFNIFTNHSLTPMCMATSFWRNKYSSLADEALNKYNAGGIYMDQACLSFMCYDSNHVHPKGGGNYWVKGFGELTDKIRRNNFSGQNSVLAGEGCGENWLPYLNAFLTLQVSRERYAGIGSSVTIPLFQIVYHQFGVTFGSYSSLVTPPYDELWPKKFAPKSPEQVLDSKFNEQFLMEQARSFVWGMQPTIANYHDFLSTSRKREIDYLINLTKVRYSALKYLLYGEFVRPPQIDIPEKEIQISKLSIYAGQRDRVTSFKEKVPLLYTSAWKAVNDNIGIALASIDTTIFPVKMAFDTKSYGLKESGKIYLINSKGRRLVHRYQNGKITLSFNLPSYGVSVVEIISD